MRVEAITTGNIPAVSAEEKQQEEFLRILQELDDAQETPEERLQRQAKEAKAELEKRDIVRRQNELYAMIAQLRSRISSGGDDPAAMAKLSAAQTNLFWLSAI